MTFVLNQLYWIGTGHHKRLVKFIHVTPKGFNLLDVETGRCIMMNGHLYSKDWRNKPMPTVITEVHNVTVSEKLCHQIRLCEEVVEC